MHKLLKQFSTLYRSKMENLARPIFDIVTTYHDEICHVKHVLDPLCVFFTLFGCVGGGGTKGCGAHNLLMQFLGLSSSKMEITSLKLLGQSQAYYEENATCSPFLAFLGLFAYPTPRG